MVYPNNIAAVLAAQGKHEECLAKSREALEVSPVNTKIGGVGTFITDQHEERGEGRGWGGVGSPFGAVCPSQTLLAQIRSGT